MIHKLNRFIALLLILVSISIATSCTVLVRTPEHPRHRTRYIWINNVYYEQVYYIDGGRQTVIVSQKQAPHKKHKKLHRIEG